MPLTAMSDGSIAGAFGVGTMAGRLKTCGEWFVGVRL